MLPCDRRFGRKICRLRAVAAIASVLLVASAPTFSQAQASPSNLPATAPSSAGSSGPPTASSAPLATTPAHGSHRADVRYDGNALTISANNSSLNQILREVARQTGMTITGGVGEDRVFGTYGPAPASAVIADLLEGSGTNVLLVQDADQRPTHLTLSPRIGGVTPPQLNASRSDDSDNDDEQVAPAPRAAAPPPPLPAANTNSRSPYRSGTGGVSVNPAATSPSSLTQQVAFPPIDGTNPPPTATTTPTTPDATSDAVRTPQQIFEQLQRLRQAQTVPSTPSTTTAPQ